MSSKRPSQPSEVQFALSRPTGSGGVVALGSDMPYFLINLEFGALTQMRFARITARGQTTIPKSIREEANLCEGDLLAFEVEGDHVTVRKMVARRDEYLQGLSESLSEWASREDEVAWRDL